MLIEGAVVLLFAAFVRKLYKDSKSDDSEDTREYQRTVMLRHYPSGYVTEEELD